MKGLLLALVVAWTGIAAAQAGAIEPGFDLFETDPEQTVFRFREEFTIPPNFFDQGSQEFQGDVTFGGVPLERFQGKPTGNADTIVQRKAEATVPPDGSAGPPIQIELVQLSLVSVAPITVNVGQQIQVWDIHVDLSPARQSQGAMRMASNNPMGGIFDSQLRVVPRFIFTRLSDRATRTLDVGALPAGQLPPIDLFANQQPWRAGCVPPALAIPGLNDGFCPGLTPTQGMFIVAQRGPRVEHGVRPVQPMLEHFKCYTGNLAEGSNFAKRLAHLTDQFGESDVELQRPARLCNPVRKNKEPFSNKKAHLQCYDIIGKVPDGPPRVLLRNQFGPFAATLRKAESLCVPSSKQLFGQKKPKDVVFTDHFQCYALKLEGKFPNPKVKLKDQFNTVTVRISKPFRLCAPVQKNNERALHPVQHLVCYRIPATPILKVTTVRNQYGRLKFIAKRGRELCVPTIKARG